MDYKNEPTKPKPPGYFVFVEDLYAGSGFSQQRIAALAASSQKLAEKWEDLSEKERLEWNESAIRRKSPPKPPGYFMFVEDKHAGSGFSQQKIAALAASSQQLAEEWEDLSEKERLEWNECAIRAPALKPTCHIACFPCVPFFLC